MATKILICDDEQEILDITQLILEDAGYFVFPVLDSQTVLYFIEKENPDILLIDLWMPCLSGDQVINQIRKNENIKHIPIIVMSASKDGQAIAYAAGSDDFLAKPFDIDALIAIVDKQLKGS